MRRFIVSALELVVRLFPPAARLLFRFRYGPFGPDLARGLSIPSWLGRQEGLELAAYCHRLPPNAVVIEIGSFLGRSAIMLAAARKRRGNGRVHCIDPFDGSGDDYSVGVYRAVADAESRSLKSRFLSNIANAGLSDWIVVHEGTAASVAETWNQPIDMLFLDGDQSPAGAGIAFDAWLPFVKVGGVVAVHNSNEREYEVSHDGMYRLAVRMRNSPQFRDVRCVETTTFAYRSA